MAGIAAAIGISGVLGAGASLFGALTQKSAAQKAIQQQQQMFQISQAANQPFVRAGQGAAGTLADLLTPGKDMSALLKTIPGFDFISKLAQMGVANQGTTTGLGGNTLLAGANAGTDIALSAGWVPIVNALQGLTNTGVQAAGNIGQFATTTGQGIAQTTAGLGSAQAAAGLGAASNVGNSLTTALLLKNLVGGGGGRGAPSDMYGSNLVNVAGGGSIPLPPQLPV